MYALMGDTSFDPLLFCFEFQSIFGKHVHFFFFLPFFLLKTSLLSSHPDFDLIDFIQRLRRGSWGHFVNSLCYQVRLTGGRKLWNTEISVVLADTDTAEESKSFDCVAQTCCQNIGVWQCTSCKIGSCLTLIDWWKQLIYGKMKEIVDSWMLGWRHGWVDGWMDGCDDGRLPYISAVFWQQEPHCGFPFVPSLFILPPASLGGMGSAQQKLGPVTLHTNTHKHTHTRTNGHKCGDMQMSAGHWWSGWQANRKGQRSPCQCVSMCACLCEGSCF